MLQQLPPGGACTRLLSFLHYLAQPANGRPHVGQDGAYSALRKSIVIQCSTLHKHTASWRYQALTMTILYSLLGNKYCISELKSCPILPLAGFGGLSESTKTSVVGRHPTTHASSRKVHPEIYAIGLTRLCDENPIAACRRLERSASFYDALCALSVKLGEERGPKGGQWFPASILVEFEGYAPCACIQHPAKQHAKRLSGHFGRPMSDLIL